MATAVIRQNCDCPQFERLALSPPWISSQYGSWATRELRGNRREYLQWRGVGGVAALVRRKAITPDFDLFVRVFEGDFQLASAGRCHDPTHRGQLQKAQVVSR